MKWVIAILEVILRALVPAIVKASEKTSEDGRTQPELKARLQKRIAAAGWLLLMPLLMFGCAPRTIYVASGEPVRIRETVKGAKVWVLDADGKPTAGRMDLPQGWYCLPDED
ncbi:MAG: hypothetical protein M0P93_08885 [Candidatus Cloacimonetes bacterium]|nr:hypothetical protein [Candidatus Cloacimonadota bacterium]